MFGDSSAALLQGVIGTRLAALYWGIPFDPITLLYSFTDGLHLGFVSMGLIIASFIGSLENFGAIQTFINLPIFFLSGALFLSLALELLSGYKLLQHLIL